MGEAINSQHGVSYNAELAAALEDLERHPEKYSHTSDQRTPEERQTAANAERAEQFKDAPEGWND